MQHHGNQLSVLLSKQQGALDICKVKITIFFSSLRDRSTNKCPDSSFQLIFLLPSECFKLYIYVTSTGGFLLSEERVGIICFCYMVNVNIICQHDLPNVNQLLIN